MKLPLSGSGGLRFLLPKSKELTNIQRNAEPPWRDRRCTRCGRRYPDVILNVNATLEDDQPLQCVSRRSCDEFRTAKR